ncbi:hypothetical protein BURK1_01325 [Burkholderiales bacterium]|nr:hypothetical protein BURK1_01325 [Burkholderiales bacterium]
MMQALALIALLAGFVLGALAHVSESPELVPWSFGTGLAALAIWIAGAVSGRRTGPDDGAPSGTYDAGAPARDRDTAPKAAGEPGTPDG